MLVMRGHIGDLLFFFHNEKVVGLDLWRNWSTVYTMKPGEEKYDPLCTYS